MSKEDIKELNLRLDRIEEKLLQCFSTNLNEKLAKKIAETNDIVKILEYQSEKEKIKQRIEDLTEKKKKIEEEILCLNDSIIQSEHRYYRGE